MTRTSAATIAKEQQGCLKDRVILVTGGARGIGHAIVEDIVRCGGRVAYTVHTSKTQDASDDRLALQADVRQLPEMQAAVTKTIEYFGRLDALVNNAGITRDKALMMMDAQDWQDVIDTNLTGVFNASRAAIVTFMKQKHGRILNIASVAGLMGAARQVNYAAAKAGMLGMTRSLAREVASYGITVNAIAPGYIETDMTNAIPERQREELVKRIPLGRFGQSAEVAQMATYLLSDAASYVTGQVFIIDGGLLLG